MDSAEMTVQLNRLIAIGEDVIKACEDAREETKETHVQICLGDVASKHSAAVGALKRDVLSVGEEPQESGSLKGAAERIIADVKATFTEDDVPSRLNDVLKQHERWLACARDLIAGDLPDTAKKLIDMHYEAVREPAEHLDRLVRSLG
jgi:uncharacterized protein (TIGR02284 family)